MDNSNATYPPVGYPPVVQTSSQLPPPPGYSSEHSNNAMTIYGARSSPPAYPPENYVQQPPSVAYPPIPPENYGQLPPPPGYPQTMGNPVVVISRHFCAPYPIDLKIVKKLTTLRDGHFDVRDLNNNLVFQIRGGLVSIRERRVISDAAGNPIVTLQAKMITIHKRWKVYRGDSSNKRDLLFSTRLSHLIHLKTELDVYMAGKPKGSECDFKVKGSLMEKSCTIYAGKSPNVIARMQKKLTSQSILFGKDEFVVTVYPDIDYAFIIALVAILNEIEHGDDE